MLDFYELKKTLVIIDTGVHIFKGVVPRTKVKLGLNAKFVIKNRQLLSIALFIT